MAQIGFASAVALAITIGATSAMAQSADVPAEFPPAAFTGNQFVDSKGCAFIRAGVGGATNWVPRVSRSRQPLCNFQPSFPDVAAGPAPGPVAPLDAPIIEITPPPVAVAAPAPAPAAPVAPAPVRRTRDVGPPIETVASIPAVPAAAAAPAGAASAAAPSITPPRITLAEACEGRTGIQRGFISSRTGQPIDCGTPPAPAVTLAAAPVAPAPAAPAPLRLTLAEVCARAQANPNIRYVHPDGTPIACDAAPAVVATMDLPAPPVLTPAPAPVAAPVVATATATCPNSPYLQGTPGLSVRCGPQEELPYTHRGSQSVPRSNPTVASNATAPRVMPGFQQVWADGRINPQRGQVAQPAAAARVSTRSTPAAVQAPASVANGHRYVQVGTFGDPANAARMIQRLGGMGYPVASAKSGNLKVIAAGPFANPDDLARALQAVRGMGFADAYTRN